MATELAPEITPEVGRGDPRQNEAVTEMVDRVFRDAYVDSCAPGWSRYLWNGFTSYLDSKFRGETTGLQLVRAAGLGTGGVALALKTSIVVFGSVAVAGAIGVGIGTFALAAPILGGMALATAGGAARRAWS